MRVESFKVGPDWSIRRVIERIDRNAHGLALVVDQESRLLDTITDGDVRRAVLHGVDLDLPVRTLLGRERLKGRKEPVTMSEGTSREDVLDLMRRMSIRHVPIVDNGGRLVDVAVLDELIGEQDLPLTAVVMAGGLGTRLRPITDEMPKTMLPVGDRPILERIVERLREAGIRRVSLTTYFRREMIADHFGDGRDFGVQIKYVEEDQPLGTAGALGMLEPSTEPLLVINGDILTRLDFRAMYDFHREHGADLTVAVKQYEFQVPFGVIETKGELVTAISEKPMVKQYINAGIYILNPDVCALVPSGKSYDMPDLIDRLLTDNRRVVSFPVREYWLDIGQPEDYRKAQADVPEQKDRTAP